MALVMQALVKAVRAMHPSLLRAPQAKALHGLARLLESGDVRSSIISESYRDTRMKLGRVVGRVVSTKKMPCLEGLKLLLVQPLDHLQQNAGPIIAAFDTVKAGEGDLIFLSLEKKLPKQILMGGSILQMPP